jgi:pimeloyl-ACP methyl ester carboxylesterase
MSSVLSFTSSTPEVIEIEGGKRNIVKTSHLVQIPHDQHPHSIHIMQIEPQQRNERTNRLPAVLLLHGLLSNSSATFTKHPHRLGCVLAKHGFTVYAADWPGHGLSVPATRDNPWHGFADYVKSTVPACVQFMEQRQATGNSNTSKQVWCGHSYGSIVMAGAISRYPQIREKVSCQVHFAAKRIIYANKSLDYMFRMAFGWRRVCILLSKKSGYFDTKKHGFGADDETHRCIRQSSKWVLPGSKWIDDEDDNFDYDAATQYLVANKLVPPTFHLAGKNDKLLATPADVQRWAQDVGQNQKFMELSRANGFPDDYDHNSLLQSPSCEQGHFVDVIKWIHEHCDS